MSEDTCEAASSLRPTMARPRDGDRLLENCVTAVGLTVSYTMMGPSGELVRMSSLEEEEEEEEDIFCLRREMRKQEEGCVNTITCGLVL